MQNLLITDLVELSDLRTFLTDWCQVEGTQSEGWQETNIFRKTLLAIELIDRQVELARIATEDCDPDPRNVSAILLTSFILLSFHNTQCVLWL